jgi:hypothetical protein
MPYHHRMSRRPLERLLADWHADADRLSLLDTAVLTYARWQGLTNEAEIERLTAQGVLDDLILGLDEADWAKLKEYETTLGERHLKGFRRHGLAVLEQDLKDRAAEVELLPEWDVERDGAAPPRPRKRPRDRDRA